MTDGLAGSVSSRPEIEPRLSPGQRSWDLPSSPRREGSRQDSDTLSPSHFLEPQGHVVHLLNIS
jgi:hypothetical protein